MSDEKEIRWVGSAYDDLLSFPNEPRRYAGFQLGKVQVGLDTDDWKPFDDVGVGTKEIRIREKTFSNSSQGRCGRWRRTRMIGLALLCRGARVCPRNF